MMDVSDTSAWLVACSLDLLQSTKSCGHLSRVREPSSFLYMIMIRSLQSQSVSDQKMVCSHPTESGCIPLQGK